MLEACEIPIWPSVSVYSDRERVSVSALCAHTFREPEVKAHLTK